MAPDPTPTLNIIGAGRVGKTLARLWNATQLVQVQDVLCRTTASATAATEFIGGGTPTIHYADLRPASVHLLAVPDDDLQAAADSLTRLVDVDAATVFHVSGLLTSDVLESARINGARTASVHPIKSFADPAMAASTFASTPCGTEGHPVALEVLTRLFTEIGGETFTIDASQKALYHAATVIGSNYVVTLADLAQRCLVAAGVPVEQAKGILAPLLQGTMQNIVELGVTRALTGPIVRGDMATVIAHLDALEAWDPSIANTYTDLATHTLVIAERQGTSPRRLDAIRKHLLDGHLTDVRSAGPDGSHDEV